MQCKSDLGQARHTVFQRLGQLDPESLCQIERRLGAGGRLQRPIAREGLAETWVA